MSFAARRELLIQCSSRYREATSQQKTLILDEFVASTGYARKYAIRLLTHPPQLSRTVIQRPRDRHYGVDAQQALTTAWMASNCICAKRLVPFLPELVPVLERHGHLCLTPETRVQLLSLSAATADRLLRPLRCNTPRGISTTKAGSLLKHQVPVRTFADWNDIQPGFVEADLVAHCGGSVEGAFIHTLVLTDIATGWTECLPLLQRSQEAVIQALTHVRKLLPFELLGLDTDNGSEFLNAQLLEYCRQEQITFTRSRAYKKNDQCHVEQKNGAVVRQVVGYGRYEGRTAYQQLAELYRAVRLYVNFFQPSMKLFAKKRDGAKCSRRYDVAQTPYQRLLKSNILSAGTQQRLANFYEALDPVRLLRHVESLQDALWRHTTGDTLAKHSAAHAIVVTLTPVIEPVTETVSSIHLSPLSIEARRQRRYKRSEKPRVPHTWRTRLDPFEAVWEEVCQWLTEAPERTAKSLLLQLQQQYPNQYPDEQLRTLQRRVKNWRREMILTFDDSWLSEKLTEELTLETSLPGALRGAFTGKSALCQNHSEQQSVHASQQ